MTEVVDPSDDLFCLVDGEQVETLPVSDSVVVRGDGCFEAIRSYDGHLFRSDDHLDRLALGAAVLGIQIPARDQLNRWMATVASGRRDCVVRIIVTRGSAIPGVDGDGHCVVMSHPLPPPISALRLLLVPAPWHPAGRSWELSGVKTVSYAPNMAASRAAKASGYDDALLVSESDIVLEGPTFSIGWVKGGRIFTPALDLGILESITRRVVIEMTPSIETVRRPIADVLDADEVFAMSTLKEITPVVAIGNVLFEPGPLTGALSQRFGLARAGTGTSH